MASAAFMEPIVVNITLQEISLPQAALWQHFLPEIHLENKCYRPGDLDGIELQHAQCSHTGRHEKMNDGQ